MFLQTASVPLHFFKKYCCSNCNIWCVCGALMLTDQRIPHKEDLQPFYKLKGKQHYSPYSRVATVEMTMDVTSGEIAEVVVSKFVPVANRGD